MSSKVRRARGNSHLYLAMPALGALEFTPAELLTLFSEANRFAEVKSAPFNTSTGTIDVTSWDSGDWQEVVPDIHSGSVAGNKNLILDAADLPQLLEANNKGKAVAYLLVLGDKPGAAAKNLCVAGFARFTGFNLESSDVHQIGFTLTIDGEPTFKQGSTAYPALTGYPDPGVSLTPATVGLVANGTQLFTSTLVGGQTGTVNYTLSPATGALSNASGLTTTYTAPATIGAITTVTLTATVGGKTDTSIITLNP